MKIFTLLSLCTVIVFLFLIPQTVAAQINLVPNPSFELYTDCPYGYSLIDNDELIYPSVDSWIKPTGGTSDYYNMCADVSTAVNTPYAAPGFQIPSSGSAYAGLYTRYYNYDYREYIQAKLTSPLISGQLYHIGFSVNAAVVDGFWGCGQTTDDVGMYISAVRPEDTLSTTHIAVVPQLKNMEGIFLSDTATWYSVEADYLAAGGEEWVTIGNFNTPVATDYEEISGSSNNCVYLYVDDVFVTEAGLLPLTITDFTAEMDLRTQPASVVLQWNTQTEKDDCCFYIERTSDGHSYTQAGIVQAKGNSTASLHYNFTDQKPAGGINYYRLKQLNNNGDFFYSPLVSVHNEADAAVVFANGNVIFISNNSEHEITALLYDMNGSAIGRRTLLPGSSEWTMQDNTSGLFMLVIMDSASGTLGRYKLMLL